MFHLTHCQHPQEMTFMGVPIPDLEQAFLDERVPPDLVRTSPEDLEKMKPAMDEVRYLCGITGGMDVLESLRRLNHWNKARNLDDIELVLKWLHHCTMVKQGRT